MIAETIHKRTASTYFF